MAASSARKKQLYGVAEWYGRLFRSLSNIQRKSLVGGGQRNCIYFEQVPSLAPKNRKGSPKLKCNKKGGVCSLRNFVEPNEAKDEYDFGDIVVTCPNRFLEEGTIIRHIGKEILGTEKPLFAKEIPFLRRPRSPEAAVAAEETAQETDGSESEGVSDPGKEDVGRIDLVFVHPEDEEKWCAVEMQAVYFSGGAMKPDFDLIASYEGNGLPIPVKPRRPDFRSSGPKRLMPQLMTKVPTLRRWGKKMAVVVDKAFFEAMDQMDEVDHISNCDIVWVVVRFNEGVHADRAVLEIERTSYTTLEDAVKGLTAGQPTTLPEFEAKLQRKLVEPSSTKLDADSEALEAMPMGLPTGDDSDK